MPANDPMALNVVPVDKEVGVQRSKKKKCAEMKRIRKKEGGDDIFHLSSPPHPPPQPSIIQHTSRSNSQYHPLLLYTESPTSVSTLCLFPLPSSPSPSSSPLPRYDPGDERPSCEMSKFIHVLFFFPTHSKIQNFLDIHIFFEG